MKRIIAIFALGTLTLAFLILFAQQADAQSSTLIFTTLGDYGSNNQSAAVAGMINGWSPDLILTMGDNYHEHTGGTGSDKYDLSTGQYYCNFLGDVTTTGTACPVGQASINRFFPAVGDHDYADAGTIDNLPATYTDYFHLPGTGYTSSSNNERYYDFVSGPVHFFILNGLEQTGFEPDGTDVLSVQAQWLKTQMGASTSTWNVVVVHRAPYSSGALHGSSEHIQWPFAQWGADVVFSGHEHMYERIHRDGIVYFVNGLGGDWIYDFGTPIEGSAVRYNANYGAQRVVVTDTSMTFEFYSIENGGTLQDTYAITTPHNTSTPAWPVFETGWLSPRDQTAARNSGDGNGYEVNPADAFADGGMAAMDVDSGTGPLIDCGESSKDKHRFLNYDVPALPESFVQGIQVRLDAHADSAVATPRICVSLSWDGGVSWSPWKASPTLDTSEKAYLLGSPLDLWGHAWAASELSNTNFQVRVANIAGDNERDFSLDWVAVQVTYKFAPPTPTPTFTPTGSPTIPATDTPTSTSSPTACSTDTPTPTASETITPSPSSTATGTAAFTPTATASETMTPSPSSTATETATFTPTATGTSTAAFTETPTPTASPTRTQTVSKTAVAFKDVLLDHWAENYIQRLYAAGITGGCATEPFQYCPEASVTRAQMAVFLERGIRGSSYNPPAVGGSSSFGDVQPGYWSAAWIKQLAADGITSGCGGGNYCPDQTVTRAQMAVFLLKAKHGSSYAPPAIGAGSGFGDVPPGHWAAAWIKQLVAEGITSGCGNGNYCPESPVTRAQMAVFLVKTFGLP